MPNALVPELAVSDWRTSFEFYRDVLGFAARYQRPEEGFVYLALGEAELMIDQLGAGRDFDDGHGPVSHPFGRGVNIQIRVASLEPLLASLARHQVPLLLPPEERWYRRGETSVGHRQLVIADPDGYLLRFFEDFGERPAPA